MNLYKHRNFSAIFSDTMAFYKTNFKHIISNLFKLVWIPLVVMLISLFALYRTAGAISGGSFEELIDRFSFQGLPFKILLLAGFVFFLAALALSVLSYSYMVIYLLLYRDFNAQFSFKEISQSLQQKKGKIIKFAFALVLIIVLFVILFGGFFVFLFSLVNTGSGAFFIFFFLGLMLLFVLSIVFVPFISLSLHNAYIAYLDNADWSLMDCINYGFRLSRAQFWRNVGSVLVMTILVQMVSGFIVAVPSYVVLFGSFILSGNEADLENNFLLFYLVNTSLSMIVNIFILPLMQTNMGIIYFSSVEQTENTNAFKELEELGK